MIPCYPQPKYFFLLKPLSHNLTALVQVYKDKGPWMLEEYECYLRGSPVPCHMRKYHTMATRSKVPHIEDWKLLPFGKKCSTCKAFLCKGKKNKCNCAL